MLVRQRKNRHKRTAIPVVVQERSPTFSAQLHFTQETVCLIVATSHALFIF
jgi:hypothetical protein